MNITDKSPKQVFNEWVNQWLTASQMAESYGVNAQVLGNLIKQGRKESYIEIFQKHCSEGNFILANKTKEILKDCGMTIVEIVNLQSESIHPKDLHTENFNKSMYAHEDMEFDNGL
jgi:hypothetical protein